LIAIAAQTEGVEEISSDSSDCEDSNHLDIYGQPKPNLDENENVDPESSASPTWPICKKLFSKTVLTAFCMLVPVLTLIAIVYIMKRSSQCGYACLLNTEKSLWFMSSLLILLLCDITFLTAGFLYHAKMKKTAFYQKYCACHKSQQHAEPENGEMEIAVDDAPNEEEGQSSI